MRRPLAGSALAWLTCMSLPASGDTHVGLSRPVRMVQLATDQTGIVDEVMVREGQSVDRGQPVARLAAAGLETALDVARARAAGRGTLAAATARFNHAVARIEQLRTLASGSHASRGEIRRVEEEREVAAAAVQTARDELAVAAAEVRRAESQLARRTIAAPFAGVINRVRRHPGEYCGGSETTLFELVDVSRLLVRFHLPTDVAVAMTDGETLTLQFGDNQVPAAVEFIAPITDADSDTVRVDVGVDNAAGRWRAGTSWTWRGPGGGTDLTSKLNPAAAWHTIQ